MTLADLSLKSLQTTSLPEQQPLVSAIVVCFNHSQFVTEALESARCQTYKNIQLIIMDDCSSDQSVQMIKEWINKHQINCHFIAHQRNQGVIKTLNEALLLAQGKYIAQLAADDKWMLDKLEYQVEQMEKLPEEVGVLYSDAYRIDIHGNRITKNFMEHYLNSSVTPTGDLFPRLLQGNFIPGNTVLVRKNCYDKVGLYDENLCYEDWDMWLRMAFHYQFAFSNKISSYYRVVPNSLGHVLFTTKNIPVALSDFKMLMKYYHSPKVQKYYQQIFADALTSVAYEINELKYEQRRNYLYQAWRYKFNKKAFLLWLFACLNIPQSLEKKVMSHLVNIKKWMKPTSH